MYLISNDYYEISINKYGSIERYALGKDSVIAQAYFVFFKEYSRLDPSCIPWDISSEITEINLQSAKISYTKVLSPPSNDLNKIVIECSIEITKHGINWVLKLLDKFPQNHRFGITVPFLVNEKTDIEAKLIKTAVSIYSKSLEYLFPDQTLLSCPVIVMQNEEYKTLLVGSMKNDLQFFCYKDVLPYIRLTTLTTFSDELKFSIKTIPSNQSVKRVYIQDFPEADFILNEWRHGIDKAINNQKLDCFWNPKSFSTKYRTTEIKANAINEQLAEQYADVLINELAKYPPGFLAKLGIRVIMLCGPMQIRSFYEHQSVESGFVSAKGHASFRPEGGHMYVCIDEDIHWIVHHEIFHFMARKLNLKNSESFYNILTISDLNPEEHWCDLFAATMTDMRDIMQDIDMQTRIRQLKNMVKEMFDFNINSRLSIIRHEATIYAMDEEKVAHPIPFGSMPEGYKEFTADADWYNSNTD